MTLAKTAARGYGYTHVLARQHWAAKVKAGGVVCCRCGRPIQPWQPWDLDHSDYDRRVYNGAAHRHCNRKAGGKKGRARRLRRQMISRGW